MGNYSKLIGSLLGGALGIAATLGLPTEWATPPVQGAIITLLAGIATWAFPANKLK